MMEEEGEEGGSQGRGERQGRRKKRRKENEGRRRGGRRNRINKVKVKQLFYIIVFRCSSVCVHWCDVVSRISNNFLFLSAVNLCVVVVVVVVVLRGRTPSVTQSIGNLKAPAGKSPEYKQQMKQFTALLGL